MYSPGQVWYIPISGTCIVLLRPDSERCKSEPQWYHWIALVIPSRHRLDETSVKEVAMPGEGTFNPYVRTA